MANKNNQSKRKSPDPPLLKALQAQKSEQKTPFSTVFDGLPLKRPGKTTQDCRTTWD